MRSGCQRSLVSVKLEDTRVCAGKRVRLWGEHSVDGKRMIPRSAWFRDQIGESGLMGRRCGIRRTDMGEGG